MRIVLQTIVFAVLAMSCSSESTSQPGDGSAGMMGAAQAQTQALQPASLPPGVTRVQPVDIVDARGFERPMVAYKALIPAGWRTSGGMEWNVNNPCQMSDYYLNWRATTADGVSVIAVVPQPYWQVIRSAYPQERTPCETSDINNVRDYLHSLAQRTSPQGRVLDFRLRPDLAKPHLEFIRQFPLPDTSTMQIRRRAEAGEILIASTLNGVEMRESIQAVVLFMDMRMADILNPGRIAMEITQGIPTMAVFMRAPAGQLNLQLPDTISKSMMPMREWSERVFAHNREKQQRAFEAAIRAGNLSQERLRQMQEAHEQRMQMSAQSKQYNDRLYDIKNASSDRQQREYIESVRGVETYHEPVDGGAVQLDNKYDHAWRLRDGSYLLTNDPNFRPGAVGLEGQELRRVQ